MTTIAQQARSPPPCSVAGRREKRRAEDGLREEHEKRMRLTLDAPGLSTTFRDGHRRLPPRPVMPRCQLAPVCAEVTRKQQNKARVPQSTPLIYLDSLINLRAWKKQTESVALDMGCVKELYTSPTHQLPNTIEGWKAKQRVGVAFNIVWHSISPAIAAYMRVLGFNRIGGKDAAELYRKAQLAAERIHIVRKAKQSPEEVDRMAMTLAEMVGDDNAKHYLTKEQHDRARAWLEKMLRRRAVMGDQMAEDRMKQWDAMRSRQAAEVAQEAERERLTSILKSSMSSLPEESTQAREDCVNACPDPSGYPSPIEEADVKPEPPELSR